MEPLERTTIQEVEYTWKKILITDELTPELVNKMTDAVNLFRCTHENKAQAILATELHRAYEEIRKLKYAIHDKSEFSTKSSVIEACERVHELGMTHGLTKPLNASELAECIEYLWSMQDDQWRPASEPPIYHNGPLLTYPHYIVANWGISLEDGEGIDGEFWVLETSRVDGELFEKVIKPTHWMVMNEPSRNP